MSVTSGDILRIVATYLWTDGNVMQNVFNAVVTGAGSPWDDDDIVADGLAWVQNLYANWTSILVNDVDGSQVVGYVYDPIDDDWDELASDNWTFNPTSVAEQIPRGVALLINMKSTDPDVSGKKYIGGFGEGSVTDGLWVAGSVAAAIAFAADWNAPFTGATSGASWQPGIWSPTDTVFRATDSTAIIPLIPAYQRRRKRGIGI